MLNGVILLLVLVYVLAGLFSMVKLHKTEDFEVIWSVAAALWFFLAVGMIRRSQIARTITVTLMWLCILILPFGIVDPDTLAMFFLEGHGHSPRELRAVAIPLVVISLIGVKVLGKNRKEFR